jgi:hypothetical protein
MSCNCANVFVTQDRAADTEAEKEAAGLEEESVDSLVGEPAHHARRPMNAFLIFCKRHRGVVRDRYPNLENRSITKILGEWWANLEQTEKASYTDLARQVRVKQFSLQCVCSVTFFAYEMNLCGSEPTLSSRYPPLAITLMITLPLGVTESTLHVPLHVNWILCSC